MRDTRRALVACIAYACACCGRLALAEDAPVTPAITMSASAECSAPPDELEIRLLVSAASEFSDDAQVKFRDTLQRAHEAFAKLEMKTLRVEERELRFGSEELEEEENPQHAQLRIARSLRLSVTDVGGLTEEEVIKTVGRLLDTSRDAGLAWQPEDDGAVVMFRVRNAERLAGEARAKAFGKAKTRAEEMAQIAGKRLGDVITIEVAEENEGAREWYYNQYYEDPFVDLSVPGDAAADTDVRSNRLGNIPVRVTVRARFALLERNSTP